MRNHYPRERLTVVSESEHHPTQLKNQLLATKAVQVQKLATIQALILEKSISTVQQKY